MLTSARLRELMHYDRESGHFSRVIRTNNRVKAGERCGFVENGYRRIRVDGRLYLAHRLAWFYETGAWPAQELDHVNGNRDDNRVSNLRLADRSSNSVNRAAVNSTGFRGVSFRPESGRYEAAITAQKQRFHLGTFDTAEEAHSAYCAAATRLHGEFARVA